METERTPTRRPALTALGLVVLVASAAFGGDWFGVRSAVVGDDAPAPRPPATSREVGADEATHDPTTSASPRATQVRSQPWWQDLAALSGQGDDTLEVAISEGAIQWRVRWSCETGRLTVDHGGDRPLIDADCPAEDIAYATRTGPVTLTVSGTSRWNLEVQQQVDVPLEEPPLAAMTDPGAEVVFTASFFDIDQVGRGAATIYRLADGSYALRLEEFFVTPNVDLEIRVSSIARPASTEEFIDNPNEFIAPLDVTAGAMNFTVPAEVDPAAWESIVIWCPPLHRAYAGATLEPA